MLTHTYRQLLLALLPLVGAAAQAQSVPASAGIDPNTFIVGHPASLTWKLVHANTQHPAVQAAARAAAATVDANQFIVQPPAQTTWTVQPQATLVARKAA